MLARAALAAAVWLMASATAAAQAVPPPGVDAARPPTERGLQVPDRSQSQLRMRYSRDCKQEARDIREQYRIQEAVVQRQYDVDVDHAAGDKAVLERLRRERDARLASLHADAANFAARIERQCREDNRATLRNNDDLGRR